jgi:ABC-type transporter Mla subunit MlaD
MDLDELEAQTREAIDQTLNQLQTATLLLAQLEDQIAQAATVVQTLSRSIEQFTTEQRRS